MLSKNFEKSYRIFCTNRYIVICLLLSVILILPFKSNAQWMPSLVGYGFFPNPMQYPSGYNLFGSQMQYPPGLGGGVTPMQGLLGYGLLGSQMQYPMGFGLGVNPLIEVITDKELISDNGLISKIKDLDGGKTAQISRFDKINGYYECIVISNDIAPPPVYNYPYQIDTNDVIVVIKCLLDEYEFVFVSKAERMSKKFRISSNDTPYYSTSPTTISYGGWSTPASAIYGDLSWLNGSGSMVSTYLNPLANSGIGGFWGDITEYSAMQYLGQRINEANLLSNAYTLFTGSIYGNPLLSQILGNTPLYGRPTIIPSETSGKGLSLSGDPLRNCHFNLLNPGLSISKNLIKTPFQFFPSSLF